MDTSADTRMDWWRNAVTLGRLIAVTVIVVGSALAIWNAVDIGEYNEYVSGPHYEFRSTIHQVLLLVWYGALVLIVAEIFSAIRGDGPGTINWQIPQLTRVLAAVIIVGGTALTIWDIQAMHDLYESSMGFLNIFSRPPGRTVSDDVRYFLEAELKTYLWQGGLLFLLAALADRLGWRYADELPEEQEGLEPPDVAQ